MILGGTYQIPVVEGLQDENWLDQLKLQDTFNEDSFEREYKITLYSINTMNCWKILRAFLTTAQI